MYGMVGVDCYIFMIADTAIYLVNVTQASIVSI